MPGCSFAGAGGTATLGDFVSLGRFLRRQADNWVSRGRFAHRFAVARGLRLTKLCRRLKVSAAVNAVVASTDVLASEHPANVALKRVLQLVKPAKSWHLRGLAGVQGVERARQEARGSQRRVPVRGGQVQH